jgi:hypothetical protein
MVATRRSGRSGKAGPSSAAASGLLADSEPPSSADTGGTPRRSGRQRKPTEKAKSAPIVLVPNKRKPSASSQETHAPNKSDQKLDAADNDDNKTAKSTDASLVKDSKSSLDDGSEEKTAKSTDSKPHTLADAKAGTVNPDAAAGYVTRRKHKKTKYRKTGDLISASVTFAATSNFEVRTYNVGSSAANSVFPDARSTEDLNINPSEQRNGYENNKASPVKEINTDELVEIATQNVNENNKASPIQVINTDELVKNDTVDTPTDDINFSYNGGLLVSSPARTVEACEAEDKDEEEFCPNEEKIQALFSKKPPTKRHECSSDSDSSSEGPPMPERKNANITSKPEAEVELASVLSCAYSPTTPEEAAVAKNEYDSDSSNGSLKKPPATEKQMSAADADGSVSSFEDSDLESFSLKLERVKSSTSNVDTKPKVVKDFKGRTEPWHSPINVDTEYVEASPEPMVTFPFDGLTVANVECVEGKIAPKSLKNALVTTTRERQFFRKLTKAPFWAKDQRMLLNKDVLADNLFCFVRNWYVRMSLMQCLVVFI